MAGDLERLAGTPVGPDGHTSSQPGKSSITGNEGFGSGDRHARDQGVDRPQTLPGTPQGGLELARSQHVFGGEFERRVG